MPPIHLDLKLLALSIALTPFTGLCAKRTGVTGTSPIAAFTPWPIVLIDFISRLGFVSPLFSQDMGFEQLMHRCHRYLKDLISEALPGVSTSVVNNTLGSSFGLRCQVALGIHLVPVNPTNVWSIYVQACLYCSSSFLEGNKKSLELER